MADGAGIQQGSPAIGAAGSAPAAPGAGGTEGSGTAGGSARIAVKKAQLRSSPRPKKLEKLGVYSSCKVRMARARVGRGPPRGPLLLFYLFLFQSDFLVNGVSPGSAAIVYNMQAKQRKPLPHFSHFACTHICFKGERNKPTSLAECLFYRYYFFFF